MDKGFEDLLQSVLKLSNDARVILAKNAIDGLYANLSDAGLSDDDFANFVLDMIVYFVNIDRSIREEEYELINEMYDLKMTYYDFFKLAYHNQDKNFEKAFYKIFNELPYDDQLSVCQIGLAILSSDGTISYTEKEVLKKLTKD